jgi:transglutaminase-like putative cysteine protease
MSIADPVRYRVRHLTAYRYSGRIDLSHSLAHLTPRDESGQEILAHRLDVSPVPHFQVARKDYFGNGTNYFAIQGSHGELEVISTFTVEKSDEVPVLPDSGEAWDREWDRSIMVRSDDTGVCLGNYLMPTDACPLLDSLEEFARPSLSPGREIMDLVNEVMTRIYTEFQYVSGATDNSTPIQAVLEQREGVCQDFAHVMLAVLRRLRIPARYVSGYLETIPAQGTEKLQGADASHAWLEVYTAATGWVGFDPTNKKIPGHQHIKIGHGRDYFDVRPLRGVFVGSGRQELIVEVDVERI